MTFNVTYKDQFGKQSESIMKTRFASSSEYALKLITATLLIDGYILVTAKEIK